MKRFGHAVIFRAVISLFAVLNLSIGTIAEARPLGGHRAALSGAHATADQQFLAVLPAGPTAVWPFDSFTSTSSLVVKNIVNSSATPTTNRWPGSRRVFSKADWWTPVNATIVDDAAAGPTGTNNDASSVTATSGNWLLKRVSNATYKIPAGTWTVAISAIRNAGTDQVFAFSKDNSSTRSAVMTATNVWQRFSYTFTFAVPTDQVQISLLSSDGATTANLYIRDFELYQGSADLGPASPDGHIYFGINSFDTRVSASTGNVNLSTGGFGMINFPASSTAGSFTAQAVISKVGAGSGNYSAFLSRIQSYTQFSAFAEISGIPSDTTVGNPWSQYVGLWQRLNLGYHVLTHTYNATTHKQILWLDDIPLFQATTTLSSFQLRDLYVNITNTQTLYGGERYNGIAYWPRDLSASEVLQSFNAWKARGAANGITINGDTTDRIVIYEGDSRTTTASTRWSQTYGTTASPAVLGINLAVSGSTLANLASRAANIQALMPANRNGRKIFVVIGPMGANDLSGYPGATDTIAAQNYANAEFAIIDTYFTYGISSLALATEAPLGATACVNVHNTRRNILNPLLRAATTGTNAYSVMDFAANATMGPDDSFCTIAPGNWTDSTHQNATGDAVYKGVASPVINLQ